MLEGLFGEAIELSERRRVAKFKEAAQAAQLPDAVVRQIATDAQFPAAFKASTSRHGPKAIAKTLNRFGVSAKYSDEGIFAFSILAILYQGWRLKAGLDELIERANKERKQREQKNSAPAAPDKN